MSLQDIDPKVAALATLLDALTHEARNWGQTLPGFETVADLVLDPEITGQLADGRRVRILEHGGFDVVKVTTGIIHFTAASGAKFRIVTDPISPLFFGAIGDGVADDTTALDLVAATDARMIDLKGRDYHYAGSYSTAKLIFNGRVIDDNGTFDHRPLTQNARAAAGAYSENPPPEDLATVAGVSTMISAALAGQLAAVGGRLTASSAVSGTNAVNAWTRRDLEVSELNTIAGASLANNQVTLPPGIYQCMAAAQLRANSSFNVRIRVRDVTNNVTLIETIDHNLGNDTAAHPTMGLQFSLSSATTFELQYFATGQFAGGGLGAGAAISPARFALLDFTRIG